MSRGERCSRRRAANPPSRATATAADVPVPQPAGTPERTLTSTARPPGGGNASMAASSSGWRATRGAPGRWGTGRRRSPRRTRRVRACRRVDRNLDSRRHGDVQDPSRPPEPCVGPPTVVADPHGSRRLDHHSAPHRVRDKPTPRLAPFWKPLSDPTKAGPAQLRGAPVRRRLVALPGERGMPPVTSLFGLQLHRELVRDPAIRSRTRWSRMPAPRGLPVRRASAESPLDRLRPETQCSMSLETQFPGSVALGLTRSSRG